MSYIGKTPTSVPLTSSDITDGIITLPKLTDGTDGNIISYDASGNPVAVATGTDGQVLTSTGAGSPPVFEALPASGITEADQWRLSANLVNSSGVNDITANLERNDTDFALIGTGLTESSGVFTFPSTGIYLVTVFSTAYNDATNAYGGIYINFTTDNSNYNSRAYAIGAAGAAGEYQTVAGNVIFDVTNTSTHKVKFQVSSPSVFTLSGSTSMQYTGVTFTRLGDT